MGPEQAERVDVSGGQEEGTPSQAGGTIILHSSPLFQQTPTPTPRRTLSMHHDLAEADRARLNIIAHYNDQAKTIVTAFRDAVAFFAGRLEPEDMVELLPDHTVTALDTHVLESLSTRSRAEVKKAVQI